MAGLTEETGIVSRLQWNVRSICASAISRSPDFHCIKNRLNEQQFASKTNLSPDCSF